MGCWLYWHRNQERGFQFIFHPVLNKQGVLAKRSVFPIRSFKYEYGVDQHGKEETAIIETKVLAETLAKQPTLSEYAATNGLSVELQPAPDTPLKRRVKVYKQGTD